MNGKEANIKELVQYWLKKSQESLEAARDEMNAGRLAFSVNRIYYACFYAVSAVLLHQKQRFQKHTGVRAAFHQSFVKSGKISLAHGKFYDEVFEARQRGDYLELVSFEREQVENWLEQASRFVEVVKLLIKN